MGNCVTGSKENLHQKTTGKPENVTVTSMTYTGEQNAVIIEDNPEDSNNKENKSQDSKVTILDTEKEIIPTLAHKTISNPKNLETIEDQKCDKDGINHMIQPSSNSDVNSLQLKEEREIAKEYFGVINNSYSNQQISEPKVLDLPVSCSQESDSNDRHFLSSLHSTVSRSEISIQENTKKFEKTGDRESDNKICLHSLLEEDSQENQIQSNKHKDKQISVQEITEESGEKDNSQDVDKGSHENKILSNKDEDKQPSDQEHTEKSEDTGDSKELAKDSHENQIRSTKNEDKQISAQENTEEAKETGARREEAEDSHKNLIPSTKEEDKQLFVQENTEEFEETGDSRKPAEDSRKNQIRSTKNDDKQISVQEGTRESEETGNSRQASEENSYENLTQSTKAEDQKISVQENIEESTKTGESRQVEDSYENQIQSTKNEDKLSELSESNILHVLPGVENNLSSLSNEEKSKIKDQQEDKSKLQKTSETNILNLQEHFTNFDPSNITYQSNSIEYILEIEERAKKFDDKVAKYSGTNYSVDYFVIDENLTRFVECLDKVKSQQDERLLKEKIRVIDYIRSLQSRLDKNVTEE